MCAFLVEIKSKSLLINIENFIISCHKNLCLFLFTVESTTSNEVNVNNVIVPETPMPEVRHENWSNIMRRFSNMSISASSTNSGSTESLSIDNEHTLNGEDRHQLKIALDMAIANRNSEHTQSLQATPTTDNEKITTVSNK